MRGGGRLFMLAGTALGLVAVALLAMAFLLDGGGGEDAAEPVPAAAVADVTVVQALRDMPAHTVLEAEDLVEVTVPETGVPADALRSTGEVIGKASGAPLLIDQRLVASVLEQPGLANEIAPGRRAWRCRSTPPTSSRGWSRTATTSTWSARRGSTGSV